jgi:hypothetical protein
MDYGPSIVVKTGEGEGSTIFQMKPLMSALEREPVDPTVRVILKCRFLNSYLESDR